MAQKYTEPVRMCVVCRKRSPQSMLLRLQCQNRSITAFSGSGRSFYLCDDCFDTKNTARALARQCKTNATQTLLQQLKEIIIDVR